MTAPANWPDAPVRYVWWRAPHDGLPEASAPLPTRLVQAVPGMGQWVLLHLLDPVAERDLPADVISGASADELFTLAVEA